MGSNQKETSSISSLKTFTHFSVYPCFRHLLRKARCRKYATGSKEEGGREEGRVVWSWNSGYTVCAEQAKCQGQPCTWMAARRQRRQYTEVLTVCGLLPGESSGVFFCVGGNNKKHHQRVPAGAWGHLLMEVSCEALLHYEQSRDFNLTAQPSAASFCRVTLAPWAPQYSPLPTSYTGTAWGNCHEILL